MAEGWWRPSHARRYPRHRPLPYRALSASSAARKGLKYFVAGRFGGGRENAAKKGLRGHRNVCGMSGFVPMLQVVLVLAGIGAVAVGVFLSVVGAINARVHRSLTTVPRLTCAELTSVMQRPGPPRHVALA